MRPVRLVRIAAEAEGIRLRRMARRMAFRAAYGVLAAIFLCVALLVGHGALYLWLNRLVGPLHAALIVLAVDVVLVVIFGLLAANSSESQEERDARQVREQAREQLLRSTATFAVLPTLARLLGKRHVYGLTLAALTAQFFGLPTRRR